MSLAYLASQIFLQGAEGVTVVSQLLAREELPWQVETTMAEEDSSKNVLVAGLLKTEQMAMTDQLN
jgi:hypothetical protein